MERDIAKRWRRSLMAVDFETMVTIVSEAIGPWRLPKSLDDAKQIADTVIDYLDPEFLLNLIRQTQLGDISDAVAPE